MVYKPGWQPGIDLWQENFTEIPTGVGNDDIRRVNVLCHSHVLRHNLGDRQSDQSTKHSLLSPGCRFWIGMVSYVDTFLLLHDFNGGAYYSSKNVSTYDTIPNENLQPGDSRPCLVDWSLCLQHPNCMPVPHCTLYYCTVEHPQWYEYIYLYVRQSSASHFRRHLEF